MGWEDHEYWEYEFEMHDPEECSCIACHLRPWNEKGQAIAKN